VRITHMTLAEVAHDAASVPPELREVDEGINAFLGDHIRGLRAMTKKRGTSPGMFTDPEAKSLFRDLFAGSEAGFVAASGSLAKRLIARMDARAANGLLICLRADDDHDRYGGILKLQVVAPNAAVLKKLVSGEVQLSAIQDLLDKPGDLQKGALSTSRLGEDRVMIGDQLGQDARYFPEAFAIKVYARPTEAVAGLITALDDVAPELVASVATALPGVASGDAPDVLGSLGREIPEFTPGLQAEVADALANQARPVAHIDTSRPATETIRAGEIRITGPVSEMRKRVRIERNEGTLAESWAITIDSPSEPWSTLG
jgi:hypothetical protein